MQRQKIQREVVTPGASAIRKANRQVLTTLPNCGDHDESDLAFFVAAHFIAKLAETFSSFIGA
jgi:hypothetical protein